MVFLFRRRVRREHQAEVSVQTSVFAFCAVAVVVVAVPASDAFNFYDASFPDVCVVVSGVVAAHAVVDHTEAVVVAHASILVDG